MTALTNFVLPTKGSGTKQLMKTAATYRIQMGPTVATKLIQNISGTRPMDTFRQYALLPRYVEEMRRLDPHGTYILKSTGDPGDNRFEFFYRASGAAKKIWPLLRGSSSVDGARYKNVTGGTILAETALTADNHLVPIAQMICFSENKVNCLFFIEESEQHFPGSTAGTRFWWQDRGKPFTAVFEDLQLKWRSCAQHIYKVSDIILSSMRNFILDTFKLGCKR